MKVRAGAVLAFGAGYVLGSRAGRARYEQLLRAASQMGRSAPVSGTARLVASKSRAAAALSVERLKDTLGVRLGWRSGDQAADAIAADLAEDLANALNHRRQRPEAAPAHQTYPRRPSLSQASSR